MIDGIIPTYLHNVKDLVSETFELNRNIYFLFQLCTINLYTSAPKDFKLL